MARLLRLEDKLAAYRARQEAASRWAWLAPMLPRLLGAPPSPTLWSYLFSEKTIDSLDLRPEEFNLICVMVGRANDWRADSLPTMADIWHDLLCLYAWLDAQPPDAFLPMDADDYALRETRPDLAAWWDACPFPRLVSALVDRGNEPASDLAWVGELRARLDGDGWIMAEVADGRGAVVTRYPWPRPDAPDRLEAARLAERALDALDGLSAAQRPQTLEEVKQWLEGL